MATVLDRLKQHKSNAT